MLSGRPCIAICALRDSIFADDTAIMDMNFDRFQEMTFLLDDTVTAFGGEVSLKKTEWMIITGGGADKDIAPFPGSKKLEIRGQPLPRIGAFCYVGSEFAISAGRGIMEDVKRRVALAIAAFNLLKHVWRSKRLSLKTKPGC